MSYEHLCQSGFCDLWFENPMRQGFTPGCTFRDFLYLRLFA
jgi:hypothetical protein